MILLLWIGSRYIWHQSIHYYRSTAKGHTLLLSKHSCVEKSNSHFSDGYDTLFKGKHSLAIVVKKIAAPRGVDINGICSSLSPVDGPLGSECYQKKIWTLSTFWLLANQWKCFTCIWNLKHLKFSFSFLWSTKSFWTALKADPTEVAERALQPVSCTVIDYFETICMRFVLISDIACYLMFAHWLNCRDKSWRGKLKKKTWKNGIIVHWNLLLYQ